MGSADRAAVLVNIVRFEMFGDGVANVVKYLKFVRIGAHMCASVTAFYEVGHVGDEGVLLTMPQGDEGFYNTVGDTGWFLGAVHRDPK